MHKRLLLSVLAALALASSFHVSVAAKPPTFLVCELPDGQVLDILIEGQGGMKEAKRHCREFWHGEPSGVSR